MVISYFVPNYHPYIFKNNIFDILIVYEYCFTSLSAQSWQYRERGKPKAGTKPCPYFELLQRFFIVHSTIGSTVHSMPLNSLEHCICTTTMTNIRPETFSLSKMYYSIPDSLKSTNLTRFCGKLCILAAILH